MKTVLFLAVSLTVLLSGTAVLSSFPAGYADNGVYEDYSSPTGAFKSYIAAVYAVDERMEISSAARTLRYRSNRYRGWDVQSRTRGLADKMRCYSQTKFRIRTVKIWDDTAVMTVDQIMGVGNPVPYVFSFRREGALWKISGMATREAVKY
jgi:hypothetical protein